MSRLEALPAGPRWQAARTPAAAPDLPGGFVAAMLLACLVLQRLAIPIGDLRVHLATAIAFAAAALGLAGGTLGLDRRRAGLLLGLIGLALLSTLVQANATVALAPRSSLPSLVYWLAVTGFAALSFARPVPEAWFFRRVTFWLGIVAAAGLLQFAAQFLGVRLFAFGGILPHAVLVEHLFAVEIPLGAGLFRSNGFFLVEPSVFSQVMAVGLMVETLYFRRPAMLALFLAGLLAAVSGTGWLVLGVFVAQLAVLLGGRGIALALGLAVVLALGVLGVVWLLPEVGAGLLGRVGEVWQVGSSGYERFVTPWMALGAVLAAAPWALATGIGPGTAEALTLPFVYHVNTPVKLLIEYGLGGLLLYLAAILSAQRTPRQRALVLPMLALLLLTGGYHQFAPMLFLVLLILTVARLEEAPAPAGPSALPTRPRRVP